MTATLRATTVFVNADSLAGGAQLDATWPVGATVLAGQLDDAQPWIARLVLQYADGSQLEHRALRGYRDTTPADDNPIPGDATYLATVIDGPAGSLHIYEVNPVSNPNYCSRCKCAIKWVRMEATGRSMPIDPFPDPDKGTVAVKQVGPGRLVGYVISKAHPLVDGYELHRNHVQLCQEITTGAVSHRPVALTDIPDDQADDNPPRQPALTAAPGDD